MQSGQRAGFDAEAGKGRGVPGFPVFRYVVMAHVRRTPTKAVIPVQRGSLTSR